MGLHKITGLQDGTEADDAVNKGQLDAVAAAAGTVSSVAISGGTTGLTTSGGPITTSGTITVAGTLVVANGGTGLTTLTANNVILGNGTSTPAFVAPGSSGNVLTSDGTTWTSAAPTTAWTTLKKTADQSVTSSTTLVDISSLTFSVAANTTYAIRCFIPVTASTGGGLKFSANGPSSPTLVRVGGGQTTTTAGAATDNFVISAYGSNIVGFTSASTAWVFECQGIVQNGSNAGTFAMQFAQAASNATPSTVLKGAWLEYIIIA